LHATSLRKGQLFSKQATAQMPIFLTLFKLYGGFLMSNSQKAKAKNSKKKSNYLVHNVLSVAIFAHF
jgi:hypothetical protein